MITTKLTKLVILCPIIVFSMLATTVTTNANVYQLANSDLLKGVLLGAIIASQQTQNRSDHMPHPILELIQKSLAGSIGSDEQQMDGSEQNAVTEKIDTQSWSRTTSAVTPVYATKPMSASESPSYSSRSLALSAPEPSQPVNHLSFPLQSMVVMLLPSRQHESSILDAIQKHVIGQRSNSADNQLGNSESTVKTNAINIGSHPVDLKGWKPVPVIDNMNTIKTNARFGRPYIERSDGYLQSFGVREHSRDE